MNMSEIDTKRDLITWILENNPKYGRRITAEGWEEEWGEDAILAFYPANVIMQNEPNSPEAIYAFAVTIDRVCPNFSFNEGWGGLTTHGGGWNLMWNTLNWNEAESGTGYMADFRASLILAESCPPWMWQFQSLLEILIKIWEWRYCRWKLG